jgi:hypothetical protein
MESISQIKLFQLHSNVSEREFIVIFAAKTLGFWLIKFSENFEFFLCSCLVGYQIG